jgi:hypothetical protein
MLYSFYEECIRGSSSCGGIIVYAGGPYVRCVICAASLACFFAHVVWPLQVEFGWVIELRSAGEWTRGIETAAGSLVVY